MEISLGPADLEGGLGAARAPRLAADRPGGFADCSGWSGGPHPRSLAGSALTRRAGTEIDRLAADAQALHDVAARETPDPIEAMLLAQRIYAGHRQGTTATAPARQTLIAAAVATARYASGGVPRQIAVDAINAVLERIRVFTPRMEPRATVNPWPTTATSDPFDRAQRQLLDEERALRALAEGEAREFRAWSWSSPALSWPRNWTLTAVPTHVH